ncbi:endolytic transglycosylase MltG [Anoxybacterium hadale]|uniref:Endolytic transglycosylase MltG n=1 Tax=Anoxybacterium hadale TaxID=3408580 RepID=A0ACD1ABE4_9FIRM|nr:endolytic transglycosylase MltG [Clostridiales bacterium]
MKKLKDIFYDMNDILVALIIVAVAGLIISSNIDTILAYPSQIAGEIQMPEKETPTNYADNPPITDPGSGTPEQSGNTDGTADGQPDGSQSQTDDENGTQGQNGNDSQGQSGGQQGGGSQGNSGTGEVVNYSVYIAPGSTGEQIANIMVGAGLFSSRQEFINAVNAVGAESKLQAGTFIIPSNSTPSQVISIITK